MYKLYLLWSTVLLVSLSVPLGAVNPNGPSETAEFKLALDARDQFNTLSHTEKKAKRKAIKSAIREHRQKDTDTDTLLLVIVTILLPPLGMYLYEGAITDRFWISLLLTLLFYLPGLIYTLIIILGEK